MEAIPTFVSSATLALCSVAAAQSKIPLVKDINTQPQFVSGNPFPQRSRLGVNGSVSGLLESEHFTAAGGKVYFVAETRAEGKELWVTDGTSANTKLVKDIRPGPAASSIDSIIELGGVVYFQADDGVHGPELWRSDGSAAGTVMVKDAMAGPKGGSILVPIRLDPTRILYNYFPSNAPALWVSNGSAGGTGKVTGAAGIKGWVISIIKAGSRAFLLTNMGEVWTINSALTVSFVKKFPNQLGVAIGLGTNLVFEANDGSGTGREAAACTSRRPSP